MNYNWNGRRNGRGRGANRNKWGWRGRNYNRMPMLDPMMHNAHPGYNQNYQRHHDNRGFYGYKSFDSPSHRKINPPPKPPSPLPGTEEYTQRNIQHTSDLIKRQLNIDSDTCSVSDIDINMSSEQSCDNTKDERTESVTSNSTCAAAVSSTRNFQEPKKSTGSQQPSKQKATSKPSECINVQEIYDQIVQHISNLSHSKKINLVNQSTDGYDIAIQQLQKQKRLELSRALRDMSKRQTQDSNDGEVINAIIPDIGIKIEDLPKEVIADLSRTLHIELEDRVEQVNNLVDPEACFKQAEAILSVNFENTMDNQAFHQSAPPPDNFGFQGIENAYNYDYLVKSLSPPQFTYNQFKEPEEFVAPSISNLPFTFPKPLPYPSPAEMNPDDVKAEEAEPDDFTADIDFCIKNLDVHKSYLTCFTSPKPLETQSNLFESVDGNLKLPQIKVRTDLLTQSEKRSFSQSGDSALLKNSTLNTVDVPQLQTYNVNLKLADGKFHHKSSSSTVPSVNVNCKSVTRSDNLGSSTAIIESSLTLDSQPDQNLKSASSLTELVRDTVDVADQYLSLSIEDESNRNPKHSEKRNINVSDYKEELAEPNIINESIEGELQPFSTVEKIPSISCESESDLQFIGFPNEKPEGLDEVNSETDGNLRLVVDGFPQSGFRQDIFMPAPALKNSLPEKKPEISSSELIVGETELLFPKVDNPLLESCGDKILTEGNSNPSGNEDLRNTDVGLSAIPESIVHTHADGPQKRWKSPGEKKMIPNVPSAVSQTVTQDNSSVAEKSIDDILNESDDITKSILEQMEEFNRSLMGITAEKDKVENVATNKKVADEEFEFLTRSTANEKVRETQSPGVTISQPESSVTEIVSDSNCEKRAKSEPREDQEATCDVVPDIKIEKQHVEIKPEVKEENVSEPTKEDDADMKDIDVKFSADPKREPIEPKLETSRSKSKENVMDVMKSEPEIEVAKPRHKEASKDRSRSNSKEKQHHKLGLKSKGYHHVKESQESHKSRKSKERVDASRMKETHGDSRKSSGSSHRKIKTPAEKKETINLKITSAVSTQTDFVEQPKKGKREVASSKSTQTDQVQGKKGKSEKVVGTAVLSTQTDFIEQQPIKKNDASIQTDFPEPAETKKVKSYTLSTQTDSAEPAQNKKPKSYTLGTQTDFFDKRETKSTQADLCESSQVKKGKSEKTKSKNAGTQSETTKSHSKEVQVTSSFKSIEIQTDPFKISLDNDIIHMNLTAKSVTTGKTMMRKYAVKKLKDIDAQIEHLMKLRQSFYELMLESDDDNETLSASSSASPKMEPDRKDLLVQSENDQQTKSILNKESESRSTSKSRKRKADLSSEDKNPKKARHPEEVENSTTEPVDEVDVSACFEILNATSKKDRKKRKVEENTTETRGPLNIKISLKNLKASPYRNESPVESSSRNFKKSSNEEETVTTKQKPRKGREAKTKDRGVKIKEEKENKIISGGSSSIDATINEVIAEDGYQIDVGEEVPLKQEMTPDIHMEDAADKNEVEVPKSIPKIKLPMKRFRSKKANSESKDLIDDINFTMSKYSREPGKVPRTETRSKRKSDRRSKQTPSDNIDSTEVPRREYDKRFFSCSVSLRRYNLQQLNELKDTIHLEPEHKKEVKSEQSSSLILSDAFNVNVDNLSGEGGDAHELNDTTDILSESLVKRESVTESPLVVSDKSNFDMSPVSLQMLDELKQLVDSTPETSEFAVTSGDTITIDHKEIEFNTFNSTFLVLRVIDSIMLAGADSGKLYYYNIENGEVLHSMHLSKKPLTSICVHKYEEKSSIYVGSLNGKISIFDFDTKHVANTIKLDEGVQCMELCWDYIFIGTHKGQLSRFDIKKEKVEDSVKIYESSILAVKATQEGARRVLLVATRNELVSVRDAMTGLLMRTMESPFYPTVYTILLHNNLVYCGTSQHDILVYTFQDGQIAFTHEATNSKGVVCLKNVGNLLFAGCYNGNVYVYNVTTNNYLGQIVGPGMILSLEVMGDKILLGTKNKLTSLRIPENFLDQL